MPLILASGSPRRKQLLECAAVLIDSVQPSKIPEERLQNERPVEYCNRLAFEKAKAINEPGYWVLAADTIVTFNNQVFEKPIDTNDAFRILHTLSNQWHEVISSWCLRYDGKNDQEKIISGYSTSSVLFRNLSTEEIWAYINTGECNDKAGAYGIQGLGACLVEEIKGSYSNIVGLPLTPVMEALRSNGVI
jgi:septum formation protein